MKRQYTRRTDKPAKVAPVVTESQPLAPEWEALAQVLADYLRRANIKLTVIQPSEQGKAAPQSK